MDKNLKLIIVIAVIAVILLVVYKISQKPAPLGFEPSAAGQYPSQAPGVSSRDFYNQRSPLSRLFRSSSRGGSRAPASSCDVFLRLVGVPEVDGVCVQRATRVDYEGCQLAAGEDDPSLRVLYRCLTIFNLINFPTIICAPLGEWPKNADGSDIQECPAGRVISGGGVCCKSNRHGLCESPTKKCRPIGYTKLGDFKCDMYCNEIE